MDKATFWTTLPVIDGKLWQRLRHRLSRPPVPFSKRMGMAHEDVNLCIDNFFTVKGVPQQGETMVRWVRPQDINPKALAKVFDEICENCLNRDMRLLQVEGVVICGSCGTVASECVDSPVGAHETYGPSTTINTGHSDKPRRQSQYIYKRVNHFRYWLLRIQGKESSGVKPSVIEAVRRELAKERIEYGSDKITYDKVRIMLKKLRLQRYYNNAHFITASLSGRKAIELTPLQEEKLLSVFHQIQEPFARHCPKDRVNMLSYSFILRKVTEALGWNDLSQVFPLLKSRSKIYAQDAVWAKICKDIDLPFVKSIA